MIKESNLVINLSRIGGYEGGLANFSQNFLKYLEKTKINFFVISPNNNVIKDKSHLIKVPKWLTFSSSISLIKPIASFLYAHLNIDKDKFIISTTHHGIFGAKNQIVTIHDLRPLFLPDSISQKIYFSLLLPRLLKKITAIFTVSETTKALIAKHYNVDSKKIFVIPNLIDNPIQSAPINPSYKEPPYILMVGATWHHKNAHELINNNSLWVNNYRLKIVLGRGPYRLYLEKISHQLKLEKQIDLIDPLPKKDLAQLYLNAKALVYPSVMEGFGIPPLEAMSYGTPTIVSDIEIFRENYGDASFFVKLGDKESWQRAFLNIEKPLLISEKKSLGYIKAREFNEERMFSAINAALSEIWPQLYRINHS